MAATWFIYTLKTGQITNQFPKRTPFAESLVTFSGDSVSATITAGQTANVDYYLDPAKFPNGVYLNGGSLISSGASKGDYFSAQVVDVNNTLGYGSNFIVNKYILQWFVDPLARMHISTDYAALLVPELYLRIIYTSVGTSDVWFGINYYLHLPV